MAGKTLEIYYDVTAVVPPGTPECRVLLAALAFRNAAMDHVETALEAQGLGEWIGAEVGMNEVNFGFAVDDFDAAEACVRAAVRGTPFDCIRQIERRTIDISALD